MMENFFLNISVIVMVAALLAWIAAQAKQPIILGYLLCGVLIGPWGLGLVQDTSLIETISRIGITLLLFLAGLVLHPQRLGQLFRTASAATLGGAAVSALLIFLVLLPWGFGVKQTLIAALALTFSSTILVVKLLPTTTLHQRHMGSVCIAILIAQDVLAVIMIMVMQAESAGNMLWFIIRLHLKAILLLAAAVLAEQFVIRRMMRRCDRYNELLIMICLAWCLGVAEAAHIIGLSHEVGAFMAGVAMARAKISFVLSEQLKPLRDFFLMLFFFVLGAQLDLLVMKGVLVPALVLAAVIAVSRPVYYRWIFRKLGEDAAFARETGMRLGQASEFSLIVAVAAVASGKLSASVSQLIQLTTVITMIISAYVVVLRYPTPIGAGAGLLKD